MIKVSVHLLFLLESREIKMSFYVAKQFLFIVALFTEGEGVGGKRAKGAGDSSNNDGYVTVQKSRMSGTLGTVTARAMFKCGPAAAWNVMGKRIAGAAGGRKGGSFD